MKSIERTIILCKLYILKVTQVNAINNMEVALKYHASPSIYSVCTFYLECEGLVNSQLILT